MKQIYRMIVYILVAAVLFAAGFLSGYQLARTATPKQSVHRTETIQASSATVSIRDGSRVQKSRITLTKNETVFSLLQKLTKEKHIAMTSSGSGKTAYVTSLNGKKAEKKAGWLFTVNGKQPNVGAGAVKVKKNDRIVWYYRTF